jgi:putative DNA primase/helicase
MGTIADFESFLKFANAIKAGKQWKARCPAHADGAAKDDWSLSITQGRDGQVVLKCHADCETEDVCKAWGISLADLYFNHRNGTKPRIVKTYAYRDEDGVLLYESVRYDPKTFKQRRPDDKGGWIWNLDGVRRVLYQLPQLEDKPNVVVVEGEKDVATAEKLGLTATCNVGGAGKWRDEYSETLRGKYVTVIPDNDPAPFPGQKHAQQVATSLYLRAASVKVLELPGAKDLTVWVERGGTKEQLEALIAAAPEWQVDAEPPEEEAKVEAFFDSYEEFETAPPLSFSIVGLLQNEATTGIAGLSGHCKSWMALAITRALLEGPGTLWELFRVAERAERVIILIPESTRTAFKHRLVKTKLYDEIRSGRLLVRTLSKGPTPSLTDPELLRAAKGAHIFIDTAVRFMGDVDESSGSDVARGLSTDFLALLRAEARTVIPLFHSPKSFLRDREMTLEGMVRGSTEFGAILATCWGIKQLDAETNTVYVQNIKPRDFLPCRPFQLIGRPHIDKTGDFAVHKKPGECGTLAEEQPFMNRVNEERQQNAADRAAMVAAWLKADPNETIREQMSKFKAMGIHDISERSLERYRAEARKGL